MSKQRQYPFENPYGVPTPPPPKPPRRWNGFTSNELKAVLILTVIFLCAGSTLAIQITTPRATTSQGPTPTTRIVTPTPHVGIGDSAVLGGTRTGFENKYGPPPHYNPSNLEFPVLAGGVPAYLTVFLDHATDSSLHALFIDLYPAVSSERFDDINGLAYMVMSLPSDAIAQPDQGDQKVFISASLAQTFPAADFIEGYDGSPVTPGTLSIACPSDASGVIFCEISVGLD